MSKSVKAAVFGAGSWGTAFGMVLADAGCEVTLWARRAELADAVNTTPRQPRLPARHRTPARTCGPPPTRPRPPRGADFAVLAVPSQTLRANLADWAPLLAPDTVLVSPDEGRRARHRPCG